MRTRNKAALIFFCLLLSAAAVLAGVNIYSELKERQKEKDDFAAVSQIAEPAVTATQTESEPTEQPAAERNIQALIAENADCIGWISIDGTNISYPVMHTPSEPQKYLAETSTANTAKAVFRSLTGGAISKAPTSLSTVIICETERCSPTSKGMWTEIF